MTIDFSKWIAGCVVGKQCWTGRLISLRVEAPAVTFTAGQFAKLALPLNTEKGEEMVGRPYSFVNSPLQGPHEFYFIVVDSGPLSPKLAALQAGETLYLAPRANGFFCLSEVPTSEVLWCFSTGTGIGPFLSILRTPEPWARFQHVVLVHAVRFSHELTYVAAIAELQQTYSSRFSYIPFVSREQHNGALPGRIPESIRDGRLEARAGRLINPDCAQTMLCGNPAMVQDVTTALEERGLKKNRRRDPGQITVETYW